MFVSSNLLAMDGESFSLEICVESLRSASSAIQGGASALELCHSLSEGGTTPSASLIRHAVRLPISVTVLIRPRRGDFLYSEEDFAVMLDDIQFCKESGVGKPIYRLLFKCILVM